MKIFSKKTIKKNFGYFGKRRCGKCQTLNDVDLVKARLYACFLGLPIFPLKEKKLLVCQKCGAYMEIGQKLWEYYCKCNITRFSKEKADEIFGIVFEIDVATNLSNEKNIILKQKMIDEIFVSLAKKYENPFAIEEILSVYFE